MQTLYYVLYNIMQNGVRACGRTLLGRVAGPHGARPASGGVRGVPYKCLYDSFLNDCILQVTTLCTRPSMKLDVLEYLGTSMIKVNFVL